MKKRKDKEIEIGLKEEDVYSEEGREAALEDDTITDLEEGFLQGYEENERSAKCATCQIVLDQHFVEKMIGRKHYRFCSEACAETFRVEE